MYRKFWVRSVDVLDRLLPLVLLYVSRSRLQQFSCRNGFSGRHSLQLFTSHGEKAFGVSRLSRVTGAHSGTYRFRRTPPRNDRSKPVHCRSDVRKVASTRATKVFPFRILKTRKSAVQC
jgi:hypothetical protein